MCCIAISSRYVQWNLDSMKCQWTRKIGLLYQGSVPYVCFKRPSYRILFDISMTLLYRGALNRGPTVYV